MLYQPHGDVTPAILPNAPRFGVCCTCVECPTRNIAARLALTKQPSAGPAAIGGLMQAVKRFEPDKGFRLATYAMWWIKASIQEYILRSWSLVKMGTTANQKKLFFNLRKAKSKISALDEGDLHPDQVKLIAKRLGVTAQDVVDMNRRLGGDASLNAPIRDDGEAGEWQDWLLRV